MVRLSIDIGIREGELAPSSLKAIRLRDFEQWVVCGSKYVDAIRSKDSIEALSNMRWAIVSHAQTSRTFSFSSPTGQKTRMHINNIFESNSTLAILHWIDTCPGCAVLPHFLVKDLIQERRYVRLLSKLKLPDYKMHAVYPQMKQVPKRTRLLLDFIKSNLER